MTTKQKIKHKAIKLFNEQGFSAVTLFEIAGALDMTRGNLAYHFKNKDVLLEAIVKEMWERLMIERSKSKQFPSFENLNNQIILTYKIQKEYAFIFLDHHVLNHPLIKPEFSKFVEQQINETEATIAYSISIGNMYPERFKGIYRKLAFNTWMTMHFWLNQQLVRGEDLTEDCGMNIWSMLIPHLTEKGIEAFTKFFGEDYIKKLGKPFESNIENYANF